MTIQGPHGISHVQRLPDVPLQAGVQHHHTSHVTRHTSHVTRRTGMLVTVEPGYYEPGAFGIRIENVTQVETCDALCDV